MYKTEDGMTQPYNIPEPLSSISCGVKNGEYYGSEACDSLFGLTSDGRAYVWAENHYGQLGLGHRNHVEEPTELPGFDNIVKFAVGEDHVLFLTAGGEVYGMGENDKGQITSSISKKNCKRPTLVEELEGINIVDIAAGNEFSLALTDDGRVYSWGTKQYGVLGRKGKSKPKLVTGLNRQVITSISCGFSHAMAATTKEVFWWGFYAGCGVPYQKTPAKVDLPSGHVVSVYAKGAALFALC
jgi:alpha-tubulin suppressor-like RCC1 family protein